MTWWSLTRNWLVVFVDSSRARGVTRLPRYLSDWRKFSQLAGRGAIRWRESYPCLTDWTPQTPFDPHLFFQACWAARKLAESKRQWHVDVGSSVMFVGPISAIVPTVFVDYRPLRASVAGLIPIGGDLVHLPLASDSVESLSCLHVIEHVGLGRYGDMLDPEGSIKAARELTRLLAPGGRLLLSTPIGRERVQFNAHRVFALSTVLSMFGELELVDMAMVDDDGKFHSTVSPNQTPDSEYACGMFEFTKR